MINMRSDVGRIVDAAAVPGAVAMAGRGPRTLGTWITGHAVTAPSAAARPMRRDTVFDLASLTKVVATTTAVLALAGRGELGLDDDVRGYLPRFAHPGVTVRHLLTHTSGLPGSRTFYQWCANREALLDDLYATVPEAPPFTRVIYSDLGFMFLGELIAAVTGEPLDTAARRLVTGPLGMTRTRYNPDGLDSPGQPAPAGLPAADFAATERRNDGSAWTGVVHDENARLMGGVAGHAGLFAPAADLAGFAGWWTGGDDGPVPVALRREAERPQTAGLDGDRGLGWTRQRDRYDILGGSWPASAVSHTGFTGTSLALDSGTGLWVVLLTNAVHFGRDATAVKALRRDLHAAVAAWLL